MSVRPNADRQSGGGGVGHAIGRSASALCGQVSADALQLLRAVQWSHVPDADRCADCQRQLAHDGYVGPVGWQHLVGEQRRTARLPVGLRAR